jgi:DNA-binding SARP family transcriptional activator
MDKLTVSLLGKFSAQQDEHELDGLDVTKIQHLFCYLLLNRMRSHPRESLATLLWGDSLPSNQKNICAMRYGNFNPRSTPEQTRSKNTCW